MEKNRELILKYLSGLLTEDEIKVFENDLMNDLDLKNEFDNVNNFLLVNKESVNEKYFINLLPNVREKIALKKNKKRKKVIFTIPALALSLILIFVLVSNLKKSSMDNFEFITDDTQALSQYFQEIDDETKAKYFDILTSQPISLENYKKEDQEKILNLYSTYTDDLSYINSLTDEEVAKIFNELNK